MPICCLEPRSSRSMNRSPAIWSENRVHRWQSTQRSRSSRISVETAIGLVKTRFSSTSRVSEAPLAIVWFCSGHSPPLSQIGQSNGWLSSRNSRLPRWAFSATGGRHLRLDDHAVGDRLGAGGLRLGHRPAAHLDLDQALPAGADRFQQRVVAEPRDGRARSARRRGSPARSSARSPRRRRSSAGRGPPGRAPARALRGRSGRRSPGSSVRPHQFARPPSRVACVRSPGLRTRAGST